MRLWGISILLVLATAGISQAYSTNVLAINDPEFSQQWIFDMHNITEVWQYGYDFRNHTDAIGLCILGEPIVTDQRGDLEITDQKSFRYEANGTLIEEYPGLEAIDLDHEAFVASVAASTINNSIGIAGIVNTHLYSANTFAFGGFNQTNYAKSVTSAYNWCATKGKIVINGGGASYGTFYDSAEVTILKDTIRSLYGSGNVLFVSPSGNAVEPINSTSVPNTLEDVLVISKSNRFGDHDTSSYGAQVFLSAPGLEVWSYDQRFDQYRHFGGSSASSPIVAASAALLWNQFPWASNVQIKEALKFGATDIEEPGWDEKTGWGLINVAKSREYLLQEVPSPTPHETISSATESTTSSMVTTQEGISSEEMVSSNTINTNTDDAQQGLWIPIFSIALIAILLKRQIWATREKT